MTVETEKSREASSPTRDGNRASTEVSAQRIFELYVDQLAGDVASQDDALVVRLRWFGQDVNNAIQRLADDPASAYEIVQHLSDFVQDLDARAGASEASHRSLSSARRWALLIPETVLHS